MREIDYHRFFQKYLLQEHTEGEYQTFIKWFRSLEIDEARRVMEAYEKLVLESGRSDQLPPDPQLIAKIEESLDQYDGLQPVIEPENRVSFWPRIAAAIALIVVGYWGFDRIWGSMSSVQGEAFVGSADVAPGQNRALLTLSDGSSIILSEVNPGEIAQQALVKIEKDEDGELIYSPTEEYRFSTQNLKKEFNTIKTPRSGQYKVLLPDGTKVWLNSMTTLRFPVTFDPVERSVELSGEAYFEVAKATLSGRRIPFRVKSNGQVIEVTGTRFNVNTYSDDAYIRTTLLEGGVNVKSELTGSTVELKPGEQSLVKSKVKTDGEEVISVRKADVEGDIAWTSGYFHFKDTGLKEVMQQLIRWYDIEVEYVGNPSGEKFSGYVSRNVSLSNVLTMLEHGSEVRFELQEGARVRVYAHEELRLKD